MSYSPDIWAQIDYSKLRWKLQDHYKYRDYAEIAFTAEEQSYTLGTNANAVNPSNWPTVDPITGTPIYGRDILFYATQDCYVRLGANEIQLLIPANTYMRFHPDSCTVIYVVRVTVNGTLRVWAEGGP